MSSTFTVQLKCDCACVHIVTHGCWVKYPDRPTESTATELRRQAASKGWQVVRNGKAGRDVCPPCRIVEIREAAGMEIPEGAA